MFSVRQFMAEMGITGDIPPPVVKKKLATYRRLDQVIRQHIETVLLELGGNQSLAASELGISRGQLYGYLKRWAIEDEIEGARCLHCGSYRLIKVEGPDGYYKCLRCRSGFDAV